MDRKTCRRCQGCGEMLDGDDRPYPCEDCDGLGWTPPRCPDCDGFGERGESDPDTGDTWRVACDACRETGYILGPEPPEFAHDDA